MKKNINHIKTIVFEHACELNRQACDFHTHKCDFHTHACDFHTQACVLDKKNILINGKKNSHMGDSI
jgi:hypothetical protein